MFYPLLRDGVLILALGPFVYYVLTIVASVRYFRMQTGDRSREPTVFPPASILKPVRGLDKEAFENFSSFCRLDYPDYEILFCVSGPDDPNIGVVERLQREFPESNVRLLIGSVQLGSNRKVNKLVRLASEARHDFLVVSDSDVRVRTSYLKDVAAAFSMPQVGAVTALFRSRIASDPPESPSIGAILDAVGAAVEFAASAILSRQLEGTRFTLGATMATTKKHLAEIGGFEALVNYHADDYELGHQIAARGYRVEIARQPVELVYPRQTIGAFLRHELRWTIGLRNARPGGHAAMLFTFGLPWTILAALFAPTSAICAVYFVAYLSLRYAVYLLVGVWGLKDAVVRRFWWSVPLRDIANFVVWLASFLSNRVTWRGLEFRVEKGLLIPMAPEKSSLTPLPNQKGVPAQ